jgi:hypothetical protein
MEISYKTVLHSDAAYQLCTRLGLDPTCKQAYQHLTAAQTLIEALAARKRSDAAWARLGDVLELLLANITVDDTDPTNEGDLSHG